MHFICIYTNDQIIPFSVLPASSARYFPTGLCFQVYSYNLPSRTHHQPSGLCSQALIFRVLQGPSGSFALGLLRQRLLPSLLTQFKKGPTRRKKMIGGRQTKSYFAKVYRYFLDLSMMYCLCLLPLLDPPKLFYFLINNSWDNVNHKYKISIRVKIELFTLIHMGGIQNVLWR